MLSEPQFNDLMDINNLNKNVVSLEKELDAVKEDDDE